MIDDSLPLASLRATPFSAAANATGPMGATALCSVVIMGVAGCGKSAVAKQLALALGLPLIEGDDFHPPSNIEKMQRGLALTDLDRADWLTILGAELARYPAGAVLTCSALKHQYRDCLRLGVPDLRFVHLVISPAESLRRVGQRPGHFYPPSLVASQFEALQDPAGEPGVLCLAGDADLESLVQNASLWLRRASAVADNRDGRHSRPVGSISAV